MMSQLSHPSASISARDIGRNGAGPKRAAQYLRWEKTSGAGCMAPLDHAAGARLWPTLFAPWRLVYLSPAFGASTSPMSPPQFDPRSMPFFGVHRRLGAPAV